MTGKTKNISSIRPRRIKKNRYILVNPSFVIIKLVCREFDITHEQIIGKERKRKFVEPRQAAMKLIKDYTNKSLKDIGNIFSGRDHTTVIHALKTVPDIIGQDKVYRRAYNNVERDINLKLFNKKEL